MTNIHVPSISIEDLLEFHKTHFSQEFKELDNNSTNTQQEQQPSSTDLLNNTNKEKKKEQEECENGDDGNDDDDAPLGYYPDGTKRTLTDEDIAYFRKMEQFKRDFKKEEQSRKKKNRKN